MTRDLVLRPYAAADRDACLAIWRAASESGHPFLTCAELDSDQVLVRETYLAKATITLACDGEEPVGFIALIDDFIGGLFVQPDRHRQGVGRFLIAAASRQSGTLRVEVYAANAKALRFYETLGFVRTAARATDDQGRPHALVRLEQPRPG
ncbi:MAG: GNAT family N-acetyltransferase [Rhodobacteraceae bacterium]|nr:GNAT family N-acetyltransferase [Paracoccaceae bacterium]